MEDDKILGTHNGLQISTIDLEDDEINTISTPKNISFLSNATDEYCRNNSYLRNSFDNNLSG